MHPITYDYEDWFIESIMTIIWELDFYSRPILDEQEKKLWEVLICESPTSSNTPLDSLFRFTQFCSNKDVNSLWLRDTISQAIAQAPQPPEKIRFFRRPMANMITKACNELNIPASVSRRAYTLNIWLEERMRDFYPQQPGYSPSTNPTVQMLLQTPEPLPEALMGEKWQFVSLQVEAFQEMQEWSIDFGETFPLQLLSLPPQTPIPGLIIYSSRALPLAAWMSGLELAFLSFDSSPTNRLLLETGGSDRWILLNLNNENLVKEVKDFEKAKQLAGNVHFLAIQSGPDVENFAGFWLMQELGI